MIKVLGIGGIFFRAKDPKALGLWYEETFGINKVTDSYDDPAWTQEAGTTVFAPFKQDTTYFGRPEQQWMINFRVADLDATVTALRASRVTVEVADEREPNGRFAQLKDPEGNPIELWQEMPPP
ncbi:VOC family protein [Loktanella sp. Alg231-35]|uniref:VOC family protein n=1 Tax=Loktanella sp. Alg231-35 TaxID=1922220 RepID=UPI000D55BA31|nr:VOC family protein [Loktanella sp. Alg231-35]